MTTTLPLILLILSLICFLLAAFRALLHTRELVDFTPLGLGLFALALALFFYRLGPGPGPGPEPTPTPTPVPSPTPTPTPPAGATYFLSPQGDDARDCAQSASSSTPKKTIKSALGCLKPGDVLVLKTGNYKGGSQWEGFPAGESWQKPITVKADVGAQVMLTPEANYQTIYFNRPTQAYIVIDGLILLGAYEGVHGYDGVKITSGAHHIRIQNCEIKNVSQTASALGSGILVSGEPEGTRGIEILNNKIHDIGDDSREHGIYLSADDCLIQGNEIYNISGYGLHASSDAPSNTLVNSNRIHHCGSSGIIFTSGTNNRVVNNSIWNNGYAGIYISGGSHTIANNTMAWDGVSTGSGTQIGNWIGVAIDAIASGVVTLENNIITQSQTYGLDIAPQSAAHIIRNNLIKDNDRKQVGAGDMRSECQGCQVTGNLVGGSAVVGIVSFKDLNFRLTSQSSAINAGAPIPQLTVDADGAPRPEGGTLDIGAYEYQPSRARR